MRELCLPLFAQGCVGALQLDGVWVDGVSLRCCLLLLNVANCLRLGVKGGPYLGSHLAVVEQLVLSEGKVCRRQLFFSVLKRFRVKVYQFFHLHRVHIYDLLGAQSLQVQLNVEDLCDRGRELTATFDTGPVVELDVLLRFLTGCIGVGSISFVAGRQLYESIERLLLHGRS